MGFVISNSISKTVFIVLTVFPALICYQYVATR